MRYVAKYIFTKYLGWFDLNRDKGQMSNRVDMVHITGLTQNTSTFKIYLNICFQSQLFTKLHSIYAFTN